MAIAGPRPAVEDGSPRRAGRGWAPHAAAAVVLVVGFGITITLSVVTASGHQRTNAKLLALETRLISDDIEAADPLYVEDHLGGAASLAAATDGGLKRLLQTATDRCGSSLDDLLTSLVSELTGDSPTDDIALIGLRWLN
jgi:hypothetical protein